MVRIFGILEFNDWNERSYGCQLQSLKKNNSFRCFWVSLVNWQGFLGADTVNVNGWLVQLGHCNSMVNQFTMPNPAIHHWDAIGTNLLWLCWCPFFWVAKFTRTASWMRQALSQWMQTRKIQSDDHPSEYRFRKRSLNHPAENWWISCCGSPHFLMLFQVTVRCVWIGNTWWE